MNVTRIQQSNVPKIEELASPNWFWPDTANRWWYMPVDPHWQKVTITGTYPKARFFSLAIYDSAPVSTGLADHLFDTQITPDSASDQTYSGSRLTLGRPYPLLGHIVIILADSGTLVSCIRRDAP
jgi:hypothetical protein